jgi:dolichol-phosphate mannosyltransferase
MIITVIIPCYNVEAHIANVIKNIPLDVNWIIVVNDRSTDNTEAILKGIAETDRRVQYINHEKNMGVGGAMITGFKRSIELDSTVTVKIDGDDQMDSSFISKLIKPIIENKADYAKGNRFRDLKALQKMPVIRRIGNLGLSFCIKAASGYWNIFDPTNGFIAINNEMLKNINFRKIHKRYFFESSMLVELYHAEAVIQEVPMKARYGTERSNLSVGRALFGFPPKLVKAFIRRILLRYFLFDFNIASIYILFGVPLFLVGIIYGIINFIKFGSSHVPAPTGTVVIPTLLIILGFQLLLSATSYDITNYPRQKDS